jgi:hypothetical protein
MRVRRTGALPWTVGSAMRCQVNVLRLPGRIALAALLAASLSVGAAAPLQAEGRAEPIRVMLTVPKIAATKAVAVKPVATKARAVRARAGGFDWLAKRRPAAAEVQLASAGRGLPRQIGRGSWICSPAGFGQKSRCHAN